MWEWWWRNKQHNLQDYIEQTKYRRCNNRNCAWYIREEMEMIEETLYQDKNKSRVHLKNHRNKINVIRYQKKRDEKDKGNGLTFG